MASVSFELETLSESSDGLPIVITGTSSGSPTNLHIASLTADELQEVYLWGNVQGITASTITLQIDDGVTTLPIGTLERGPDQGSVVLLDGHVIADGITISAYDPVGAGGTWVIYGRVHKVTNQ